MATAIVTSKGQITIPVEVKNLGLKNDSGRRSKPSSMRLRRVIWLMCPCSSYANLLELWGAFTS